MDPGLDGEESPGDIQAAGIVLCELGDTRMCPAEPYNTVWVVECSRRAAAAGLCLLWVLR